MILRWTIKIEVISIFEGHFFNFKLCEAPRTSYHLDRRFNVHGSASTDRLSMSRTANGGTDLKLQIRSNRSASGC